jgi:hypothetical protein
MTQIIQTQRSITIPIVVEDIDMPLWMYLTGGPLAVLWWQASSFIDPHWYLHGNQ